MLNAHGQDEILVSMAGLKTSLAYVYRLTMTIKPPYVALGDAYILPDQILKPFLAGALGPYCLVDHGKFFFGWMRLCPLPIIRSSDGIKSWYKGI